MAILADPFLILIFVIVGLLAFGIAALVLFHSDPKPKGFTWIVALGVVIMAGSIVTFLAFVILLNIAFG